MRSHNVLSILKKKNKVIQDEVSSILSSNSINALRPLAVLSKTMSSNPKVSLEKFITGGHNVTATFSSAEPAELEAMNNHLKNSGLPELRIDYNSGQNTLTVDFADRE